MRLKNKNVIVTGSGNGIGRAIAEIFAKEGANIIVADIEEDSGLQTVENITNAFGNAKYINVDTSDISSVQNMVQGAISEYGDINILVNNCSTWFLSPIMDLEVTELDEAYNNILKSTIIGTKNIAALMKNTKEYNSIVNISSSAGIMPQKNASIYACLKAAIIHFTTNGCLPDSIKG